MNIKLLVLLFFSIFIISGCTKIENQGQQNLNLAQNANNNQSETIVASFLIFTNNLKRVFTEAKYHNLSPNVYIEGNNPAIINVSKQGTTWGDFFKTLPLDLTQECLVTGTGQKFCTQGKSTLKFYLNGEKIENPLEAEIKNGDKLLVSYGAEIQSQIEIQLNQIPNP